MVLDRFWHNNNHTITYSIDLPSTAHAGKHGDMHHDHVAVNIVD